MLIQFWLWSFIRKGCYLMFRGRFLPGSLNNWCSLANVVRSFILNCNFVILIQLDLNRCWFNFDFLVIHQEALLSYTGDRFLIQFWLWSLTRKRCYLMLRDRFLSVFLNNWCSLANVSCSFIINANFVIPIQLDLNRCWYNSDFGYSSGSVAILCLRNKFCPDPSTIDAV